MLSGDSCFGGSVIILSVLAVVCYMSLLVYFAQDDELDIAELHVIQTLFCWPSFLEMLLIAVLLYFHRDVERILGLRSFMLLLISNFLTFIPTFLIVIWIKGCKQHFSLLLFIPYAVFVYAFDNIPPTPLLWGATDKLLSFGVFISLVSCRLPESILCLVSALCGYFLWKKFCK